MRIKYDRTADRAYIYVADEIRPGGVAYRTTIPAKPVFSQSLPIVVDFDADGRLLGIEIVGASKHLPESVLPEEEEPPYEGRNCWDPRTRTRPRPTDERERFAIVCERYAETILATFSDPGTPEDNEKAKHRAEGARRCAQMIRACSPNGGERA